MFQYLKISNLRSWQKGTPPAPVHHLCVRHVDVSTNITKCSERMREAENKNMGKLKEIGCRCM